MSVILASKSPRRSAILTAYKIPFNQVVSDYKETHCELTQSMENWVKEAKQRAYQKAIHTPYTEPCLIIGSDTMVIFNNQSLSKPKNSEHAKQLLALLSGQSHTVISTGCVYNTETNERTCMAEVCEVTFKENTQATIEAYINTHEVLDKAGGYGIQDCEDLLISHYSGSKEAIMGLPIDSILKILAQYDIV